jgi:predicted dehydrogenase
VGSRREYIQGASTYTYQLGAFVRAVREGVPVLTNAGDAVANMRVIDAVYAKAGLQPRGMHTPSTP